MIFFFILTWSFFFFVGPIWGQINAISVLLTFLAFEAVINKQTGRGALYLGLATALKIYPIVTLPAFLVYVLKNRGKLASTKLLVYTVAVPTSFYHTSIFLISNGIYCISSEPFYTLRPLLNQTPSRFSWLHERLEFYVAPKYRYGLAVAFPFALDSPSWR